MIRRVLVAVLVVGSGLLPGLASAQGTKLWSVGRYDEMERGTAESVAIRSDGRLEAGPATSLLYATGKSYVWSLTSDSAGDAYAGLGGTAAGSAVVMKVTPDGRAAQVFEGKELAVQAMRVAVDGNVLAATSPDGKVYRIPKDGGSATVVFDPALTEEKPKYLWDLAVGKAGEVYVAAGAPAVVYRVPAEGGKAEVLFNTADQHIRCLLMGPDGTLWAGSDGSGVIYRFATGTAGAKPFAAYAAARREITALAMDAVGNVYAAGVGTKGHSTLPPLPVTGNVGVSITFVQPGSSAAAGTNGLVPDGSEIYRISADGSPEKLLTLKDDVVYALAVRSGSLLAATGNRGRVYRVDTDGSGRFSDVAHLDASQGMAFAALKDGLLVATSNSGKVFRLGDAFASAATYTSEVFDALSYAQWGRAEVRAGAATGFDLYVRSGNVENPLIGWSDWVQVGTDGAVTVSAGRLAQWKAVLRAGGSVDEVGFNYLQKNLAPVVDEIVVQPGARVMAAPMAANSATVQVVFPAPSAPAVSFATDPGAGPLTAQKDKTAVTVRWQAHDDNGDDLMFALWYRGVGERNWRLLKDKILEKVYSFDSALLPDGSYELKLVASDAPVHTDAEALTGNRVSEVFVVDTTPPMPGMLKAEMATGPGSGLAAKIRATLEARDATSPIAHAEYSVDAGPWQYLEPVGKVSDSLTERYDFTVAVPTATADASVADAKEHVLAVRVYDRYENVVAVKAVVR
ncbi:SMP-30/gluconolactonase/LRE family protein [Granulicella sp. L60]|uniref:SMP-30/gluconolactonase/LRE family protein n=1 Tax=Granulicella sp. L60 TaxID=1641866 RepID=UPI0020B16266|nr:SMP-30/gluconolactonase/LRE family protein [Granulicella sp. L60]